MNSVICIRIGFLSIFCLLYLVLLSHGKTLCLSAVHYNRSIIIHALQGRNTKYHISGNLHWQLNTEAKFPPDWSVYEFLHNHKCFLWLPLYLWNYLHQFYLWCCSIVSMSWEFLTACMSPVVSDKKFLFMAKMRIEHTFPSPCAKYQPDSKGISI